VKQSQLRAGEKKAVFQEPWCRSIQKLRRHPHIGLWRTSTAGKTNGRKTERFLFYTGWDFTRSLRWMKARPPWTGMEQEPRAPREITITSAAPRRPGLGPLRQEISSSILLIRAGARGTLPWKVDASFARALETACPVCVFSDFSRGRRASPRNRPRRGWWRQQNKYAASRAISVSLTRMDRMAPDFTHGF